MHTWLIVPVVGVAVVVLVATALAIALAAAGRGRASALRGRDQALAHCPGGSRGRLDRGLRPG